MKVHPTLTYSRRRRRPDLQGRRGDRQRVHEHRPRPAPVTHHRWGVDRRSRRARSTTGASRRATTCGAGAASAVFSFSTGVPGAPADRHHADQRRDLRVRRRCRTGLDGRRAEATRGRHGMGHTCAHWRATGFTGNVWRVPNNTVTSDRSVLSPSVAIPAAQAVILSFDTYHSFEIDGTAGCWDSARCRSEAQCRRVRVPRRQPVLHRRVQRHDRSRRAAGRSSGLVPPGAHRHGCEALHRRPRQLRRQYAAVALPRNDGEQHRGSRAGTAW